MSTYIGNAFSCNMIEDYASIKKIDFCTAELMCFSRGNLVATSCIGHADTAAIISNMFNADVPMNRTTVKLVPGDFLVVCQYSGPRLPEGTTTLPEGSKIEFFLVKLDM
jgi:hypothetical protein